MLIHQGQRDANLSSSAAISTAGYFRLGWSSASQDEAAIHYELQQARNQQFTRAVTIYEGPDRASVVSGLADQVYFFVYARKAARNGVLPVRVEVKHHSLTRAFGFFDSGRSYSPS